MFRDRVDFEPIDVTDDEVMTQREAVDYLNAHSRSKRWTLQQIAGRLDSGSLTTIRRLARDDAQRLVLRSEIEALAETHKKTRK